MKIRKYSAVVILGCFLGFVAAVPAHADLYWESSQQSQGIPGSLDGTQIVKNYMTENATRYETQETITIVDLAKMKMFSLDKKAKTFNELDLTQMGQVPGMEGEAGKQLMGMIKGLMGTIKVTPTKETRTISGYSCTRYDVSFMGTRSEHWVTRNIKGLDEMLNYGKKFSEAMNKNPMMRQMNIPAMMKDLNGFPVETTVQMMGGKTTTTLEKIEQKKIGADLFKVPSGYKKTE